MKIGDLFSKKPAIMGILNVTPDSFYDGDKYNSPNKAYKRALKFKKAGADIIDIGGESTRPGAKSITVQEEKNRVLPVIKKIKQNNPDIKISCDTSRQEVAREALSLGADMINDVTGFENPGMRDAAAESGSAICIMHMKGNPVNMQQNPQYEDVISDIRKYLHERAQECVKSGIARGNILIDPGIGFGKTLKHNLKIMANIDKLSRKYPVLLGASRKSFLKELLNIKPSQRLSGSLAVACWAGIYNVSVLRVHDVRETIEAVEMTRALISNRL